MTTATRVAPARARRRCWVVGALVIALVGCTSPDRASGDRFVPRVAGTLTVATSGLPAPGLWERRGGSYRGFEADLAAALVERLDLDRYEVVEVPFADLVAGRLGEVDVAIAALTPTAARDEVEDFTTAYLEAPPAVLAGAGVAASDARGLRELRWVVVEGSTLSGVVGDRIRPEEDPLVVADRAAGIAAVRDGLANAVLLDLPVAIAVAREAPDTFTVVGRLPGDEDLAVALPDGSPNRDAVDAAIRRLVADGTIDDLAERWLGDTDDVPYIRLA